MIRRLSLLLAAALVAIAACAQPKVIAHRGYWQTEGSAQNSIRSLVKADSIGCYGSEFDVWLTADNQLVVNHNRDINGKDIETGNSAELLRERLPNGEYLSTLSQYLDAGKDLRVELILEVKPHRDTLREDIAVPMIIDMVAEKGLTDRTTYITFSRHAFDLLVAQSGRPVYFLTGTDPDELAAAGGTGPDYHISHFRKHPEWRERFRQLGMPVNIWTIAKPADMQYCIDHQADFVTTDIPEVALQMAKESAKPFPLTVMTFNLHAATEASIDSIAAVINAAQPDFVALQEVDMRTKRANAKRHNGHDWLSELAVATGLQPLYGRAMDFAGGYYGIGLLSKHPMAKAEVVELPNPSNVEPRVLLEGTFLVDGHKPVTMACTHLSVESEPTRVLQAKAIADRYASAPNPVILAGDFNSLPGTEPIAAISKTLCNLSGFQPSYPADKPNAKLDYIFGTPGIRAVSAKAVASKGKTESDHRPVVANLEVGHEMAEYGIGDLCLIYQGGSHRIDWTEEHFMPYVSHRFADGQRQWTFDGFLFLELRDDVKRMRLEPFCMRHEGYADSKKEDWLFYLDRLFERGKSLDALDKTIGKLKGEIGEPGFKHKVVLTVLPPCRGLDEWGELDGQKLGFSNEDFKAGKYADAITACSWFLDNLVDRYNQQGYENLDLAGIYWLAEDSVACYSLPKHIAPLVHAKGLNFIWIPYYQAPGYDAWAEYGFDKAYHQPNHFFSKSVPDEQLDKAIDLAAEHGLNMEFEFDSSARHDLEGSNYSRMQSYIDRFEARGIFDSMPIGYYTGSYGLIDLAKSGSEADQAITDRLFRLICPRRQQKF